MRIFQKSRQKIKMDAVQETKRSAPARGEYGSFMIRRAWITEKAGDLQKFRKYIFIVRPNATKPAIKAAVENSYKVKVTDVHILTVKGPVTRRGGRYAKEPDMKKAIVTLTEGNTIDLMPA